MVKSKVLVSIYYNVNGNAMWYGYRDGDWLRHVTSFSVHPRDYGMYSSLQERIFEMLNGDEWTQDRSMSVGDVIRIRWPQGTCLPEKWAEVKPGGFAVLDKPPDSYRIGATYRDTGTTVP